MHARLLHGCMSHSITDDGEYSNFKCLLAPFGPIVLSTLFKRQPQGIRINLCDYLA